MSMTRSLALATLATIAPLALSACADIPDAPIVTGTPLSEGTSIALMQPVKVGDVVVTPREVVEDSCCPINAICVDPGRLIVRTRIDGAGWRDTADLTLGETFGTHGQVIALVSGEPGRLVGQETPPETYRFSYELR